MEWCCLKFKYIHASYVPPFLVLLKLIVMVLVFSFLQLCNCAVEGFIYMMIEVTLEIDLAPLASCPFIKTISYLHGDQPLICVVGFETLHKLWPINGRARDSTFEQDVANWIWFFIVKADAQFLKHGKHPILHSFPEKSYHQITTLRMMIRVILEHPFHCKDRKHSQGDVLHSSWYF